MESPNIVLIDMTQYGPDPEVARIVSEQSRLTRLSPLDELDSALARLRPALACFEYDFPDIPTLAVLTRTKQALPSLPVVMFTEQHSEALAVWALRARVWNYFVKPLCAEMVSQSLNMLLRLAREPKCASRKVIFPPLPLPKEARFRAAADQEEKILRTAVSYIDRNLDAKLMQSDIARRCSTSIYRLSRTFKGAFGFTFQEYILRRRLEKARDLLRNNSASIADVCWAVGFRDASYFTRMFRRYSGLSPSEYRRAWHTRRESGGKLSTRVEEGPSLELNAAGDH